MTCGGAIAQDIAYPIKPVRFIIPVPPGGGSDLLARTVAQKLTEKWGQSLVMDYRSGAGGTIAVDTTAKASPDGYTLVMGLLASIAVNVSLMKLPYDPVKDLAPVTLLAVAQNILVVHPTLPATSVRQLIEMLKAKPGFYNYGSAGNGTSPHLSGELFKIMAGVSMNHVPYKGVGPLLSDLLSGQLSVYFGSIPSTMPHAKAGKLRALAVAGSQRSQMAPELPSIAEAGLPGFDSIQWYGILAPAKTPSAITSKLNRDTVAVLNLPEVKERLFSQGFEVVASSREEYGAFIRKEIAKWGNVIKQAGIHAD
jgi:tripartite-type tricarboxylate transporter receptor subunit TctC